LLLNAIEALDANSNPKKIIAITYEITDECVLIKLFDNGSSIHPSKASKLFTLFSTTKTQGLGVGLWLSKFIMEKQGGDLSFANGNQGGVEFTLTIPKKLLVKQ
jgi:C4-dicarboxylate-specific signal transduction histidine kinase